MSNIRLPADFGLNKLRSRHHGNILINLSGGKKIWANSVILALNSPVIERMFGEADQPPQLDLSEYRRAAVIQFIEAIYTGQLKFDTVLFRDVHKLALVFEVSWLQKRCEGYLEKLISQAVQDDYDSVYYLLEETRQTAELTQNSTLLNIVIEKISSNSSKSDFVTRYMADYITLSKSQLDIMIFVSRDQPTLLVKIVIQHIESNKLMFDEATKYILTNLDLLSCLVADKVLYDCLFDLLFEKVINLSFDDLKLIATLHKSTFEAYLATITAGSDREKSDCSSSPSQTTISKSITIDSLPIISRLKSTDNDIATTSSTDSSLEEKSSSSLPAIHTQTSSLFRGGSYVSMCKTSNLPIISPETLGSSQSLHVPNLFHSVKSLQGRSFHGMVALNSLLHSDNVANLFMVIEALPHLPNLGLCSVRDTVQLEAKNFTTLHDLMRKGGPVHFQFPVRLGGGKFTINVQSASNMDIQKNFDIKLQEKTKYQGTCVSGDKLHLVVKEWDRYHGNRVLSRHVTWCGRPSVTWCGRNREKKGRLSWGEISEFRRIKIVVYCDVRQIAKR